MKESQSAWRSSGADAHWRTLRAVRWRPWALLGMAALAWWSYSTPAHLTRRIRSAVEEPAEAGAAALIASRVDFARVNAQLAGDLHSATQGHLNSESFSRLLLYGWLPQQSRKGGTGHTRRYHVRYKDLNRVMVIYWDAAQIHEVVLTLQRKSVLHRWHVTRVHQFNVCEYDFDCALVEEPALPKP